MYPLFVAAYGLSVQTISVLTFLQSGLAIFVSPLIGGISDLKGNFSDMMVFGIVILAIGTAGYAVSVLFTQGAYLVIVLLAFTILIGVGSSFYHPLGATVLRAKWAAKDVGRALGINGTAGGIGRVVLPFAAAAIIAGQSLPTTGLLAVLAIIGAFAIATTLRGVEFSHRPRADYTLLRLLFPPGPLARKLTTLTIVSFTRGVVAGVLPFIPLYLTQVDRLSPFLAGLAYSASLGIGIPSNFLFGLIQNRFGSKATLAFSNLGGVVTLFVFAASSSAPVVYVSLLLYGFFSYGGFTTILGMVQDLTEFHEMTSGGSLVWGVGNTGGSAVAPLIVGLFALPWLFGTLTAGFAAVAAIGVLSVVLMPWVKPKQLETS